MRGNATIDDSLSSLDDKKARRLSVMQSFATFLDAAQNLTASRQRDFMAKVANLNIYFT
jgi:hypothetical protein